MKCPHCDRGATYLIREGLKPLRLRCAYCDAGWIDPRKVDALKVRRVPVEAKAA